MFLKKNILWVLHLKKLQLNIIVKIFHDVHSPSYYPKSHTICKEKTRLTVL